MNSDAVRQFLFPTWRHQGEACSTRFPVCFFIWHVHNVMEDTCVPSVRFLKIGCVLFWVTQFCCVPPTSRIWNVVEIICVTLGPCDSMGNSLLLKVCDFVFYLVAFSSFFGKSVYLFNFSYTKRRWYLLQCNHWTNKRLLSSGMIYAVITLSRWWRLWSKR